MSNVRNDRYVNSYRGEFIYTRYSLDTSLTHSHPDGVGKHLSLYQLTSPLTEAEVKEFWARNELPFYTECLWQGTQVTLIGVLRSDFVYIEGIPYVDVVAETLQRAGHLLDSACSYLNITHPHIAIIGAPRETCSVCNFPLSYPSASCAYYDKHALYPPVGVKDCFLSEDDYYYYVLTEMDGRSRMDRLGVSRAHYVDSAVARSWANDLKQRVGRLGPIKATYAEWIIDKLYREMATNL